MKRLSIAALLLALVLPVLAQQPEKAQENGRVCGGGRTVDDYLADIAKSKKRKRNANPLPDGVCIFGWCRDTGMKQPPKPTGPFPSPPSVEVRPEPSAASAGTSSSKREQIAAPPVEAANANQEACDPVRAAQDVEVGDFYYSEKSYKAALNRYKLAMENWPHEPAIHFRSARAYEGLKDPAHAAEQYQLTIDSAPNAPLAKEARAALERLKK